MLASFVPSGRQSPAAREPVRARTRRQGRGAAPQSVAKPGSLASEPREQPEPQLAEEGEENEDEIAFEPLPAAFLLEEKPLASLELAGGEDRQPVLQKFAVLMSSPSALASEEFDRRLQVENLYEAHTFKGAAIAFIKRRMARIAAAAGTSQAMR